MTQCLGCPVRMNVSADFSPDQIATFHNAGGYLVKYSYKNLMCIEIKIKNIVSEQIIHTFFKPTSRCYFYKY